MIVEKVPEFICSHKTSDAFVFDKNGRFVYICRSVYNEAPIFMIYDIMFNSYIQLTAAPSICNFNNGLHNFVKTGICTFLPIETEKLLVVLDDWNSRTILIALIHLDLPHKHYELLDTHLFCNCYDPELVTDGSQFGLFCMSNCKNLHMPEGNGEETEEPETFTLTTFMTEFDKIEPGTRRELKYDHYKLPAPTNLYLSGNKLWFVRDKERRPNVLPPQFRHLEPPVSPTAHHMHISHFDLNKECPVEVNVGLIQKRYIAELQWVRDSLLFQFDATKFAQFNTSKFEWSTLESNTKLVDPSSDDLMDEWSMPSGPATKYRDGLIQAYIDENFFVTAIHKPSKTLHKIPLRTPPKLLDIAWICALNKCLLSTISEANLPYSRLF